MAYIEHKRRTSRSGRDILLRDAIVADAADIRQLKEDVISEGAYMLREPGDAELTVEAESEEILSHLGRSGCIYVVAAFGHSVAGFLEFSCGSLKRIRHSGMFSMYVKKEFRGDGIGSMLLEELISWAENDPVIEKLTLAVFSTNKRAIMLYEKYGFATEGICPRDMKLSDGTYIDSILMYRFVK